MRRYLLVWCLVLVALLVVTAQATGRSASKRSARSVSVFASGFNNPRGLTFGPDGNLYVAEGGLGGGDVESPNCPNGVVHGAAFPYSGSTTSSVLGGRISKVSSTGVVSTVVDALPSSQTSAALGSLVSGVSSVAFIGNQLYGLLSGAGCTHGVPRVPNGVIKVGPGGTVSLLANLSAFQAAHPVAHPDDGDFEPDGTWYSMAAADGALFPMDSNHGELDRVTTSGAITRVLDISDKVGHIVPTAIVRHDGAWYIANLGVFGPEDGNVPNESVYRLASDGSFTVVATGLEQVLGLAFIGNDLYALEMSSTPGGPTPGTGAIVLVRKGGLAPLPIVSGLVFPTGMTVGPDGAFYVSAKGFGFGAGAGQVLRIVP
jgi:hypothetical protein